MRVFASRSGRIKLVQADFVETLATFSPVDLVVTSPPYVDARAYGAGVAFGERDLARLGDAMWSALRLGGQALVVLDAPVREWRGVGTERGLHPWRAMIDWADRVGFRVADRLAYARAGAPGDFRGRFRNDWEPILWLVKPGGEVVHDPRSIAEDARQGMRKPLATWNRDGSLRRCEPRGGWATREGKRLRGTLWDYGHVGGARDTRAARETRHPARFPLALARDLVLCFSRPGDLVCDPFLGSGTSLVAAVLEGRRFAGGDLLTSPQGVPWVRVALERAAKDVRAESVPKSRSTAWERRDSLAKIRGLLERLYPSREEARQSLWRDLDLGSETCP